MSRKRPARVEFLLLLALLALTTPPEAVAAVCDDNQDLTRVDERDRIGSDYFDAYHIAKSGGVYRVHARKRVAVEYPALARVMDAFEDYPRFMPGYEQVTVRRSPDGTILNAIRYRADFAFFTSRFTTLVDIIHGGKEYWQCWNQLDRNDERVLEEYAREPGINRGFWRLADNEDGTVEIEYFSAIRPPIPIPRWLYKRIAGGSYEEVFEAIVERARGPRQ